MDKSIYDHSYTSPYKVFEEVKTEVKVEKKAKNATVKKEAEVYHEMYY